MVEDTAQLFAGLPIFLAQNISTQRQGTLNKHPSFLCDVTSIPRL